MYLIKIWLIIIFSLPCLLFSACQEQVLVEEDGGIIEPIDTETDIEQVGINIGINVPAMDEDVNEFDDTTNLDVEAIDAANYFNSNYSTDSLHYWDNKILMGDYSSVYLSNDYGQTKKQILSVEEGMKTYCFRDRLYLVIDKGSDKDGIYLYDFEGNLQEKISNNTPKMAAIQLLLEQEYGQEYYDYNPDWPYALNVAFTENEIFFEVLKTLTRDNYFYMLYAMDLDGGNVRKIIDDVSSLQITNDCIYYTSYTIETSNFEIPRLYRVDKDGSNNMVIIEDGVGSWFVVYKNHLYYETWKEDDPNIIPGQIMDHNLATGNEEPFLRVNGQIRNITHNGILFSGSPTEGDKSYGFLYSFSGGKVLWSNDDSNYSNYSVVGNKIIGYDIQTNKYKVLYNASKVSDKAQ